MRRYERASTLLTTTRPVDDWGKLLGGVDAVSAMLDRLLHHGHVLKCGPKRRMPRSREQSRLLPNPQPDAVGQETDRIGLFVDPFAYRAYCTMTSLRVVAQDDRVAGGVCRLHQRRHLAGMGRGDTGIPVAGRKQDRGIFHAIADVVIWGVLV